LLCIAGLSVFAFGVVTGSSRFLTILGLFIGLGSAAFEALSYQLSWRQDAAIPLDSHADRLASTLQELWMEEARARQLDGALLPITWSLAESFLMDPPDGVGGPKTKNIKLKLHRQTGRTIAESSRELAKALRDLPIRRAVVIGEPGSGKTAVALMLTLGTLAIREPGEAIPIFLAASTWDPVSQHIDDWIQESIANVSYNGQRGLPRRLARQGLLCPVIDGLDEIPEAQRRLAVKQINQSLNAGSPVVITCRDAEYQDLILSGAPRLHKAPVIQVHAVSGQDAVTYLEQTQWRDGSDWSDLRAALLRPPGTPVRDALSTPLMLSLTKTIFENLDVDPNSLANPLSFESRHSIEDFLTDHLVEAAYVQRSNGIDARRLGRAWESQQARRWLTYVAGYLHQHRERDLDWWKMAPRLLSPWTAVVLGIVIGFLCMIGTASWITFLTPSPQPALSITLWSSAAVGVGFAILTMLVWYGVSQPHPHSLTFTLAGGRRRFIQGWHAGIRGAGLPAGPVAVAIAIAISLSHSWTLAHIELLIEGILILISLVIAAGFSLGVQHLFRGAPMRAAKMTPQLLLHKDRNSALAGATVAALVCSVVFLPLGLAFGCLGSLTFKWLSDWAGWPSASSYGELSRARAYDMTLGVFHSWPLVIGATIVLPGLVVGLLVMLSAAWPRFLILRLELAARGKIPRRFASFLANARDRNLLRQHGGSYQFRHVRLQEHLANSPLTSSNPGKPFLARRYLLLSAATVTCFVVLLAAFVLIPKSNSYLVLSSGYMKGPLVAAFSQNGRLLSVADSKDGYVSLFNYPAGTLLYRLPAPEHAITGLEFSPDARVLKVGVGESTAERFFDTYTGRETTFDVQDAKTEQRVDFVGPGHNVIIESGDDEVRSYLVDAASGSRLANMEYVLNDETSAITTTLVSENDSQVRLINVKTGAVLRTLTFGRSANVDLDGAVLKIVEGASTKFVDAVNGTTIGKIPVADSAECLFSAGLKTAIIIRRPPRTSPHGPPSLPNYYAIWDLRKAKRLTEYHTPRHTAGMGLELSADGRRLLVTVYSDNQRESAQVIDPISARRVTRLKVKPGDGQMSFLESKEGTRPRSIQGRGRDNTFKIWNATSGAVRFILSGTRNEFEGPVTNPAATRAIVYRSKGDVSLVNLEDGQVLTTLHSDEGPVLAAFDPKGRVLLSREGAQIELWDTTTGSLIERLPSTSQKPVLIDDLGYNEQASRSRWTMGLHSSFRYCEECKSLPRIADDDSRPVAVQNAERLSNTLRFVFTRDGRGLLVVSPRSERAQLYNLTDGRPIMSLIGHSGPVAAIATSPDGDSVISSGLRDDTIRLWKINYD
jgi:WD40 repeat protein